MSTEATAGSRRRLMVAALAERALDRSYDSALLMRLVPYMAPHKWLFIGALVLMPVGAVMGVLQPWLKGSAVNAMVLHQDTSELMNIVWLFGALILAEFVARFGQTYLMQLAGQRSTAGLRSAVFDHIQRLRVGYFDRTPAGRVVTRVTNDIDSLTELFASGAVTAVTDLVTVLGIVIAMLIWDWELSLVTFLALPPLALAVNIFRRWAREAFRSIRLHIAQLNAYLAEQVQGVRDVQAYNREADCAAEYRDINRDYRDANYRSIKYDALLYSVVQSVSVACVALVLYYAGVRAGWLEESAQSALYVGTVVAFYDWIERFFVPIRDLATKYTIIQSSLASAERVFGLIDTDELDAAEIQPDDGAAKDSDVAIELDHVTFAYRQGHPVLHDVSLSVKRGEQIAIVGATGSGKTTVTALLLRLYELQEGAIRVDGHDVRSLERHALRHRFGVVPQDVFLFSGTLRENLTMGAEDADDEALWSAIDQVGARQVVQRRGGLDGHVEERGQNFSAGERQLLALARALYRDAQLLILDEATANVDSETEAALQQAVEKVLEGRTAIVIAHRLSTIRRAHRIVVMHRGRIAEMGTHEELLESGGIYARLHALQADHQRIDGADGQPAPR